MDLSIYGAPSLHVLFECEVFKCVREKMPDGPDLGVVLRKKESMPMVKEICRYMRTYNDAITCVEVI